MNATLCTLSLSPGFVMRSAGLSPKVHAKGSPARKSCFQVCMSNSVLTMKKGGSRRFRNFRSLADELPALIYTTHPDGSAEYINRYLLDVVGYTPQTYYGLSWIDLIHPQERDAYVMVHLQAFSKGEDFSEKVHVRMPDGSYQLFRSFNRPKYEADGTITRWFGVAVPLEERTEVEDAHRTEVEDAHRTELAAVSEAISQIAWTADPQGRVDWYNKGWYEYTGKTREDSLEQGWQGSQHPDDMGEVQRLWSQGIASGEHFEIPLRLRRADGVFRWFLLRVHPWKMKYRNGEVLRWYGSYIDIDEQQRTLKRSLRIAQTLQDVFLPKDLPHFDDLSFDATYSAAEGDARIGGDWYDATTLADGRILLSIGDVAGHGLEASISVGRLRQMIFTIAFETDDPASVLTKANHILHYQAQPHVTAIVGFIDPAHTTLTYACAGHPPPVLALPSRAPIFLPYGGLPLGIERDVHFERHDIPLTKGSVAVFYTDGLTESQRDIEKTERHLLDAVSTIATGAMPAHPALSIEQIILAGTKPSDDIAILLVHLPSANVAIPTMPARQKTLLKTWRFHSTYAYGAHASRLELMQYIREIARPNEDFYTCELILGELLANVAEHAPGLVEIIIDWTGENPEVHVFDTGPGISRFEGTLPEDILDENGRGLFLIKTLTHDNVSAKLSPGYGTEIQVLLPISRGE